MLHIGRADSGLAQRLFHRTPSAVAVFRARRQMVGIGTGAITHQFRQGLGPACQGMFQRFDHQHAGTLGHDKAIAITVEGTRGLLRALGKSRGQRASRREAAQGDTIDCRFGTAAQGDIRLTAPDQPGRIANGLHPSRAGRYRRAKRPLETMADGNVPGGHVGQESRCRER
ncbi:hypothetical protein D3C76_1153020 [compost metagenome]